MRKTLSLSPTPAETSPRDKPTRPFISLSARLGCFLNSILTLSFGISREQVPPRLLSLHARAPYAATLGSRNVVYSRQPVSYVRNRSLPLVPPGVARSLRKHVRMHGWRGLRVHFAGRCGCFAFPPFVTFAANARAANARATGMCGCAATFTSANNGTARRSWRVARRFLFFYPRFLVFTHRAIRERSHASLSITRRRRCQRRRTRLQTSHHRFTNGRSNHSRSRLRCFGRSLARCSGIPRARHYNWPCFHFTRRGK